MTSDVLERARGRGVPTVVISGEGTEADLHTSPQETSATFTASHLGALLRLAQLAQALGATLGRLEDVPDAVAAELDGEPAGVAVPARFMQFAGTGINAWTAAEGALKIAEAAFVASEGLSCEHDPRPRRRARRRRRARVPGRRRGARPGRRPRERGDRARQRGAPVRPPGAGGAAVGLRAHCDRAEDRAGGVRGARHQPRLVRPRPPGAGARVERHPALRWALGASPDESAPGAGVAAAATLLES